MSDKSAIDWTDSTWNVVTGCTRVSPGCGHCYIERQTPMRIAGRRFHTVGQASTTGVQLHPERLERVPRGPKVFICSMSDLFHEHVPFDFIWDVFHAMQPYRSTRIFQLLTKRPERALEFFRSYFMHPLDNNALKSADPILHQDFPHVWVGVSIENARYSWRADVLRKIPAAVRFISAEPLLGSLFERAPVLVAAREGIHDDVAASSPSRSKRPLDLSGIDWLIVGGESGGRFARPMRPEWTRELRDACVETAFFFKQWGSWGPPTPGSGVVNGDICWSTDQRYVIDDDYVCAPNESDGEWLRYYGAAPKSAGHLLDGVAWREFPTSVAEAA